ncbi:MAG: DUF697 domain-containing protein [Eggerthellaceae bacterium]
MKLPVDIPEVILAAIDIDRASTIPVSVNILIDETASPDFQVFVRAGFNSESPNSRVYVSYFPTQTPDSLLSCDLTIIAAGQSDSVGALATAFREQGTPALVVAQPGASVREKAEQSGHPIPEEDLLFVQDDGLSELSDDVRGVLADKIGRWIVDYVEDEKHLAFSIAYPFVRRPLAYGAINTTALQNAGVGVLVFIPGADMPLMTANQIKMVLQIAAAYGQPLGPDRAKELIGVLANAFICRGISRQVAGLVPALGWAVKGSMGYLGTQAIGRAAIEYFEGGGSVAGLAALAGKVTHEAVEVVDFVQGQPTVRSAASAIAPKVRHAAGVVLDAAAPVAKSASKTVFKSLRPGRKKGAKQ